MANRRQFIQSGLALSAIALPGLLPVFPGVPAGGRDRSRSALRIERFVFDNRFPEAVEAARHAASQGIRVAETSGDMTDLWYDDLDRRWKEAPMRLAGMTTWHGLFVLETLAADRRMRVVYRSEQKVPRNVLRDGGVAHVLAWPRRETLYSWIIAPRSPARAMV